MVKEWSSHIMKREHVKKLEHVTKLSTLLSLTLAKDQLAINSSETTNTKIYRFARSGQENEVVALLSTFSSNLKGPLDRQVEDYLSTSVPNHSTEPQREVSKRENLKGL
ncbi:hypothetical protein BTVI_114141 [Pitangus sulphuratus]|nr:hypothetical protein BTVI_114141 [Pitangus sulphuratus]